MEIAELNTMYQDADACDAELFAEQRSNVLLVAGIHYSKRNARMLQNLRRKDQISQEQKIRLTKNHIQKISKSYVNNILTHAPGVFVGPRNKKETSDQKAADLNNSVWQYLKENCKLKKKMRDLCHNFVDFGEAVVKIFYDPMAGDFVGYEPVLDEMGAPVLNEDGEPEVNPIFSGDVVFEIVAPFNLMRDPSAKSFDDASYLIIRKMVNIKDMQSRYRGDEDKLKMITESSKTVYQVFETSAGAYKQNKDEMMVREFYFRKCAKYPNGYYVIATESGILHEGDMPFGIFPLSYVGFDSVPTYARSYSIIKQARPYQAEINRASSKVAEHQVTLGDDKVVLLNGSTITPGGTFHGIRSIKVTGGQPTIIPGRSGDQFFSYIDKQIEEMYSACNVVEDTYEKEGQNDPYSMLFRSIKEKKKFVIYAEKWQEFYTEIAEKALDTAKQYITDDQIIPVFGKNEIVNIPEWKSADKLRFQIMVEPTSEDFESKMGRQLSLNHILQYVGQNLDQGDVGKLIRAMPYVNEEEMFTDLTIDYDNVTNDVLSLDRGEYVPASPSDNHEYYIKKLVHRTKQSDFKYLGPEIQGMYQRKIQEHEQLFTQQQQEAAAAESGFVPSGGYLVACDVYIPHPTDPSKLPRRARIPFEAVQWLLKKLESQGLSQQSLQSLPPSTIGEMNQMGLSSIGMDQGQGMSGSQPPQASFDQQLSMGEPPESIAPMQGVQPWTQ